MEKLELKHLAPYLPYNLKGMICDNTQATLCGMNSFNLGMYKPFKIIYGIESWDVKEFKPILRPLSDLELDKYNFIYENETDYGSINAWLYLDTESKLKEKYSYEFWHLLFENHFDVFGLIEKNLAVDINTL
jgi:hypothetical protein